MGRASAMVNTIYLEYKMTGIGYDPARESVSSQFSVSPIFPDAAGSDPLRPGFSHLN